MKTQLSVIPAFFVFFTCVRADAQLLASLKNAAVEVSSISFIEQFSNINYSVFTATAATEPEATEDDARALEDGEDSTADIFISSAMPEPPAPVNLGGNGNLTLKRQDTGEKITVRYRNKDGSYDQAALARINHLMRCSLTGREVEISVKLVELLDVVEDKFGKRGLTLLSGYRTAKLNGTLPDAARNSLHMLGWAADIRIPGYTSTIVKKYALKRGVGGVGYYPSKGFTHLDVGRTRYWVVKKPPRKRHVRRVKRPPAAGKNIQKQKKSPASRPAASKRGVAKKETRLGVLC